MRFVKLDHKGPSVSKAREAYRAHFADALPGFWTERQEQDLAVWIAARAAALEEVAAWYADKGWLLDEESVANAIRALATKPQQEGA